MRTLVVDASVAVKWQLRDEEHVDIADAIKEAFLRHTVNYLAELREANARERRLVEILDNLAGRRIIEGS